MGADIELCMVEQRFEAKGEARILNSAWRRKALSRLPHDVAERDRCEMP